MSAAQPTAGIPADLATLLRRLFPFYCALVAAVTFGYALYDPYNLDGDAIAYMDIGDLLRAHRWAGIVNGYWHPMYPAFLSLGHTLFRANLARELHAYYMVNYAIFLLEMVAVVCFVDSIVRLRRALQPVTMPTEYLMGRTLLRYFGLTLLVIASQRELSVGKVRPDALLQALILFALAALLTHLATNRMRYAALMGLALGCAYLTKSFAFLFALLCILALAVFRWIWLRQRPIRILPAVAVSLVCFGALGGPYIAALSHQKGRLDFGDSGSLNFAWYVGGTEKMHLEPWMTSQFGSAEVHLKHPEKQLLQSPPIYSYAQLPYGTYPAWFDTTYWNDQIKPHFTLRGEASRGSRNLVLVVRYLFNHPEALLLLAVLTLLGARPTFGRGPSKTANAFWLVPLGLGMLVWGIYAIVNTEERYVTVAYLSIILTTFATLRIPSCSSAGAARGPLLRPTAQALVLLVALMAVGESLRTVLEDRRQLSGAGSPGGWYSPTMVNAAAALGEMGVRPGDTVACVGGSACLYDFYWARLAGVRILTEIYDPATPVYSFLADLANRDQAFAEVRAQGSAVLVGDFGQARLDNSDAGFRGWQQLGGTTFYALPLNLAVHP